MGSKELIKVNEQNISNAQKYELIVKLKELLVETAIKNNEDVLNYELISLNASKVLNFISQCKEDNPQITDFYTKKLDRYMELKSDKEKYNNAHKTRKEQIYTYLPVQDFKEFYCLGFLFPQLSINEPNEYLLEINPFNYYDYKYSIFQFINLLIGMRFEKEPLLDDIHEYCLENLFINMEDDETKTFVLEDCFTSKDNDAYRQEIAELYDYYFLTRTDYISIYNGELFQNFYLYIAYRKVLKDLLEYIYNINLSDAERMQIEQFKLTKRLYFDDYEDLKDFSFAHREIITLIANGIISPEQISQKRKTAKRSTISEVSKISSNFKDKDLIKNKRAGIPAIYECLQLHPEWFEPKVRKSKEK